MYETGPAEIQSLMGVFDTAVRLPHICYIRVGKKLRTPNRSPSIFQHLHCLRVIYFDAGPLERLSILTLDDFYKV